MKLPRYILIISLTACANLGPEYESNLTANTSETASVNNTTSTTLTTNTETTTQTTGTGTTTQTTKTTGTSMFSPMFGLWERAEVNINSDTCGINPHELLGLSFDSKYFDLQPINASSFSVLSIDNVFYTECTNTGSSTTYLCDEINYWSTPAGPAASHEQNFSQTLRFDTEIKTEMLMTYRAICTGDCVNTNTWENPYECNAEINFILVHSKS